jgi:hypothetical protein
MLLSRLKKNPELDARLGRVVYGNLCAFSYNFEGRRNLQRRRAAAPRLSGSAAVFVSAMAREGFYRLPELIPQQIMSEVIKAYRYALADPARSTAIMSQKAQQAGLDSYCRAVDDGNVPELLYVLTTEVEKLISSFFGGPPAAVIACARRTEHIPRDIAREYDIYSNSWHCDNEPSERMKMFVALSAIDDESGPLHLLSRPRTRQILRRGFKTRDDYGIPIEQIEDPKHLVKFVGPVGSVIFTNVTQCLHRAGVPAFGRYRDIAEFQFRAN